MDDEAGWKNWDVETDSSESDSEGWVQVSSDGEDLAVSDSEDEKETSKAKDPNETDKDTQEDNRISTLATTKVNVFSLLRCPPAHIQINDRF